MKDPPPPLPSLQGLKLYKKNRLERPVPEHNVNGHNGERERGSHTTCLTRALVVYNMYVNSRGMYLADYGSSIQYIL